MATISVMLNGGVTYHAFGIDYDSQIHTLQKTLPDKRFADYDWNENTKLLANFNEVLSGGNFDGTLTGKAVLYKTIGNSPVLHKVCETDTNSSRIVEDFTVGDLCDIQYYLYSIKNDIIDKRLDDGITATVNIETCTPILSQKINMQNGVVAIIGLLKNGDGSYSIDENNIWNIRYNVTNDGYTLNTDKTFYQSQYVYGKESGGNRKQRSIPITGMLAKLDCSKYEFVDKYDYIVDWETFAASSQMKMLIDLRGVITLGDIDINPSFKYDDTPMHYVSVSFTFTQLDSLDNVDVLGREITSSDYIITSDNYVLQSADGYLISATEE